MPLTGGYRRTPTLQIGADIYCDTQIILRELERRFPMPTLFPGGNAGIPWALSMWTDRTFFMDDVKLTLGARGDAIPAEFLADREKLFDAKLDIAGMRSSLPQSRDQFRAHIGWIEAQLDDGRPWLLVEFSLADVSAYMIVWHVRTGISGAAVETAGLDTIFRSLPRTLEWERRMQAIGHGTRTELSEEEAPAIAAAATPQTAVQADPDDPNDRKPGSRGDRARRLWESGSGGDHRLAVGPTHRHRAPREPGRRRRRPFPARGVRGHPGVSCTRHPLE